PCRNSFFNEDRLVRGNLSPADRPLLSFSEPLRALGGRVRRLRCLARVSDTYPDLAVALDTHAVVHKHPTALNRLAQNWDFAGELHARSFPPRPRDRVA